MQTKHTTVRVNEVPAIWPVGFRDALAQYDAFGDDFEREESGYGVNMPASKVGKRLRDWSAK